MALSIPDNFEEAIEYVLSKSGWADIIKETDKERLFVVNAHMGLGQWMRNNWGFWSENTNLYLWFLTLGISHPDDMSSIILTSAYRRYHKKDIDLKQQVKDLKAYWDLWKDEESGDDDSE